MRWGDIVRLDLDPVIGSEANKVRPAVVVSNDGANQAAERFGRGLITVAPITADVAKVYPLQVLVSSGQAGTGLTADSKIQVEQLRAVDVAGQPAPGRLPTALHEPLREALTLHRGLRNSRST